MIKRKQERKKKKKSMALLLSRIQCLFHQSNTHTHTRKRGFGELCESDLTPNQQAAGSE